MDGGQEHSSSLCQHLKRVYDGSLDGPDSKLFAEKPSLLCSRMESKLFQMNVLLADREYDHRIYKRQESRFICASSTTNMPFRSSISDSLRASPLSMRLVAVSSCIPGELRVSRKVLHVDLSPAPASLRSWTTSGVFFVSFQC